MDRGQFDDIARLVWTKQSRRGALAALLGAALLGTDLDPAVAKGKRRRGHRVIATAADRCFPGTNCTPGAGRNTARCDFSFSSVLRNKNVRGSNLSRSNFVGADLRGADFRGANVSGSCFISADLTGAKLGGSVNLGGAVFCNTVMPDGTRNNSGCEGATPCCHLRTHDCPDVRVGCLAKGENGTCVANVGDFPPVGTCWNRNTWTCCPCEHPDYDYWQGQCEQTFSQACNPFGCVAEDEASVWECYRLCRDES